MLVSGLRGTGAQVAAALVLAGTGRVVLHDRGVACTADRGQQVPAGAGGVLAIGTGAGGVPITGTGEDLGNRCKWGCQ